MKEAALPLGYAAAQHGPRPLPLFLEMLRSETEANPERQAAALAGLKAYQEAPRQPREDRSPLVAQIGDATLRDRGGEGRPVIFVPSLINPPFVLDLAPDNSLLKHVALRGFRPLLVDWGEPDPDAPLDIAGQVEHRLLPLIETLGEPPVLAGYCLGGTMALAAACLAPVAGLALIATPWRFSGFAPDARAAVADLWRAAESACRALALVPMEVLQTGFWRLDPARTVAKYEAFAAMDPASEQAHAFVALEDWANAGAPLSYAAGRELFETLYADDATGRGEWRVAGTTIDPAALPCLAIEFVSTTDRIVPAASAVGLAERRDTEAGHVGMVVGSRARTALWEPLTDWLSALPAPR